MRYVESINRSLHDLMAEDERVYMIGEDILSPYGGAFKAARDLSEKYPDRILTTPISEAAITGIATGMAIRGLRPIVEIMFGDFITLCADQLINSAGKFIWMYNDQVTVPMVLRTPMGGRRGYGPTHSQTIETIFMNIPGLTIAAPSHYHRPGELLNSTVRNSTSPTIFIENKLLYAKQLEEIDDNGKCGDFYYRTINKTHTDYPTVSLSLEPDSLPDITLIVYGGMAPLAVEAAYNAYMKEEITVEIVIPSLVKPAPYDDLIESARKSGRIIIAEESNLGFGWGAEIAAGLQVLAFDHLKKPISRIGSEHCPIPSARPLEDEVLPQAVDIEQAIYRIYGD